ncbi:MAG: sigma-54 dependent transcriptional regulator [Massilibacteroides sp.]|nr:sigma-54 dependent transcriptional regulator [Massilibacteroides sp.]
MNDREIRLTKQRFGIIGTNATLNTAIDVALQVAHTDLSVLVTGESGVGKESFPQIVHQNSARKHGQYIAVNCGAIPEGTIDSELFGHEKGSFTGALADRKGYFEVANGGTIFLDEVGELPTPTQARLLRILESGEFIKVGSSKVQKTDVRVVAATNIRLREAVSEGRFREDLFYRLNAIPITIPALRERPEDIPLLFRKFASDFAEKYRMPTIRLDENALRLLVSYSWPGNVRELKNITERISIIEETREITLPMLQKYIPRTSKEKLPVLLNSEHNQKSFANEREILYQVLFDMRKDVNDLKKLVHNIMDNNVDDRSKSTEKGATNYPVPTRPFTPVSSSHTHADSDYSSIQEVEDIEETLSLEEVEREMIKKALNRHGGKRRSAASDLRISERTLYRKIKEYGLDKNNK